MRFDWSNKPPRADIITMLCKELNLLADSDGQLTMSMLVTWRYCQPFEAAGSRGHTA